MESQKRQPFDRVSDELTRIGTDAIAFFARNYGIGEGRVVFSGARSTIADPTECDPSANRSGSQILDSDP